MDRSRRGDEPRMPEAGPPFLGGVSDSALVSGHVPPAEAAVPITETPEHDWAHAAAILFPAFRPVGTKGVRIDEIDLGALTGQAHGHAEPIIDEGPAGLAVVYALQAGGFDVIVNAEHLLSWSVGPEEVQDAALRNLGAWSAEAAWTDEVSGDRRLLSSDTGEGWDAVRILLPEVRQHLARELGATGRVLVGLPERHLLIAGTLRPGDTEFAALIAGFVAEHSDGADEPIDQRVFELVDGRLVEFSGAPSR